MADDTSVVTSITSVIATWTMKTLFIALILLVCGAVYYLFRQNAELEERIIKVSVEAAECRAKLDYMRSFK
jgi:hypothetical protein